MARDGDPGTEAEGCGASRESKGGSREVTAPAAMPVTRSLGAAAAVAALPEGLMSLAIGLDPFELVRVELVGAKAAVVPASAPLSRALVIVPLIR